jgi:type II secretory pathway pseudopilin PulG
MEMLIVILVIGILVGLAYPVAIGLLGEQKGKATQTLVSTVSAAIASYGTHVQLRSGERLRLFDMDGDGEVDGSPAKDLDASVRDKAIEAGYGGPLIHLGINFLPKQVNPRKQPVDAWQRPLRIAFGSAVYGANRVGVWSLGPDGKQGTDDDLTSWGANAR